MQVGTVLVALPSAHSASLHLKEGTGQLEQTFQLDGSQPLIESVQLQLQWAAFDSRCQCKVAVSSGALIALIFALTDDSPKDQPLQVK